MEQKPTVIQIMDEQAPNVMGLSTALGLIALTGTSPLAPIIATLLLVTALWAAVYSVRVNVIGITAEDHTPRQ